MANVNFVQYLASSVWDFGTSHRLARRALDEGCHVGSLDLSALLLAQVMNHIDIYNIHIPNLELKITTSIQERK